LPVLFLRQRSILSGLLALVVNAALLLWVGDWVEVPGQESRAVVLLLVAPAIISCIAGISTRSPSADIELTSSFPLAALRVIQLSGLLVVGIVSSALIVDRWLVALPGEVSIPGIWVRNVIGLTGLALILARFVNPRLSWVAPCLLAIMAPVVVLPLVDDPATPVNEQFQPPRWLFTGHDQRDIASWAIALGLFVAGLFLIARFGPKVTEPGEE
jgi:hypothetical protein